MKIVHVCITSPWGEMYAYQENLLPHYHRMMGHEVAIIAPVYSLIGYENEGIKPTGERVLDDGTRLIRLAPQLKCIKIDAHLHLVKGLKEAILKENPDLLFVHDVCSFSFSCLKSVKGVIPHLKIVMDNHSDLVNSLHSPITKFLHKFIYRYLLLPELIDVVDCFYGVTPSRCDFLRDIYRVPESRIKLLVMGADDEKMMIGQKDRLRAEVRKKYGIHDDDFLIVTGGKIDRLKNIHILAHAVNSLGRDDVKLLVFGRISDEMQPLFKAEESPHIITIGWYKSDKVYELFYAADIIVFPGLHSVLWEQAVASKTPCAFSKIDGFEHVNVNDNCILMTGKNAPYYATMIKGLIDNSEQYKTLKNSANNPLLEQFFYSRIAHKVLADVGIES